MNLLVVEDEKRLNTMILDYFSSLGYSTSGAHEGKEALRLLSESDFDLIILDLMLPGMDGFDVIRRIRGTSGIPIIMLTARSGEGDKLMGLELGADDYITKPFSMKELAARVRAVLRRTGREAQQQKPADLLRHRDLEMDMERRKFLRNGIEIPLTSLQFDMMKLLLSYPGRVFTRWELLDAAQEGAYEGYDRTVDVHIKNIRKVLEPDPSKPRYIETVRGVGYRLGEGD
jgi:DNA-binding response OmpR family regulator